MSELKLHSDSSNTLFSLRGSVLKFDTLEEIQPYLDHLQTLEDLEEIVLGGNTLGIDASVGIGSVLASKTKLRVADFSDIFTGRLITEIPQALLALCNSLIPLPNLVQLDLSDNAFGGRSVDPMLELLSTHPTLETVKISNNGMGPAGGEMVANAIKRNAEKAAREGRKSSIKRIIVGRNRLENGSSTAWAEAYAALGTLVEVRMYQNGINKQGIKAIVAGLANNPDLEVLDLQDNTATVVGSRAIAAALPSWPKLKELDLNDCLLRSKGGYAIMNALANGTNKELTTIKLQSNELNAKCINELAVAIKTHLSKLTKLELNGNYGEEEDECFATVKEALENWGHGEALDELDELEGEEEEEESDEDDQESEEEENGIAAADDKEEAKEPAVVGKEEAKESDDLANLLGKVHI